MSLLLSVVAVLAGLLGDADRHVACLVLGGLDQARAAAFATGDPARLDDAYASAEVSAQDRDLVLSYRKRGVRLVGAVMHRESCAAVRATADRVELEVVDRLGPAVALGREIRPLPRDAPSRHRITLVATARGWRIGAVVTR